MRRFLAPTTTGRSPRYRSEVAGESKANLVIDSASLSCLLASARFFFQFFFLLIHKLVSLFLSDSNHLFIDFSCNSGDRFLCLVNKVTRKHRLIRQFLASISSLGTIADPVSLSPPTLQPYEKTAQVAKRMLYLIHIGTR